MTNLETLLAALTTKADAVAKAAPAVDPAKAAAEQAAADKAAAEAAEAEQKAKEAEDAAAAEKAAAEAAEKGEAEGAKEGGEDETETQEDDETEGDFGKSFTVTGPDGKPRQAIDGFELLKALRAEIDGLRAEVETLKTGHKDAAAADDLAKSFADFGTKSETLAKALGTALDALAASQAQVAELTEKLAATDAAAAKQAEVVKSLAADVEKFGAAGVGRRSTVSVHERSSTVAKSETAPTLGEIFAKAEALNKAGKLNGLDVARITAHVNGGRGVPAEYAPLFAAN